MPGATTNTLTINNVQESNTGVYTCVVSNSPKSTTTSNAAKLTLSECWHYVCKHSYISNCQCSVCSCAVMLYMCAACVHMLVMYSACVSLLVLAEKYTIYFYLQLTHLRSSIHSNSNKTLLQVGSLLKNAKVHACVCKTNSSLLLSVC